MSTKEPLYPHQIVPLLLTFIVLAAGIGMLYLEIISLNHLLPSHAPISIGIRWPDILVGLTIYLKTSIDFAIFIGRLMDRYPGWKHRIAIEIGTALGNILGTLVILLLWALFRDITILMAIMVIVASLVLLRMAEDGLDHVKDEEGKYKISFGGFEFWLERILASINKMVAPMLSKILPHSNVNENTNRSWWGLLLLSFTVPFILGLDDFAGYVPLFNIINVFGFAIGVFTGHTILSIALFLSPKHTIRLVKHPIISFIGSLAFIGLAIWGLYEAYHLIAEAIIH